MHWYLRGHFVDYGVEFVSYQLEETKLQGNSFKTLNGLDISAGVLGDDPFNLIFPKMTKCSLDMYGPSGSIINYDGLCVLPVNVLNEKIFLIIWTIFIPLLILSVIEQVVWLVFIANPTIRLLSSITKWLYLLFIYCCQKPLSSAVDLAAHEIQGRGEQGPEEQEGVQREEGAGQDKPEAGAEDSGLL